MSIALSALAVGFAAGWVLCEKALVKDGSKRIGGRIGTLIGRAWLRWRREP